MLEGVSNVTGIAGVVSMLAAYILLQRGAVMALDRRYLWMNCLGAVAVMFSLLWAWNLPSFLVETAWAGISAYSLLRSKNVERIPDSSSDVGSVP